MYKIDKGSIGNLTIYRLVLAGLMDLEEMDRWVSDSQKALSSAPSEFVVYVDMSSFEPPDDAARSSMHRGRDLYKNSGMLRSAVLLSDEETKAIYEQNAAGTDVVEWERYFSKENAAWSAAMESWLAEGAAAAAHK